MYAAGCRTRVCCRRTVMYFHYEMKYNSGNIEVLLLMQDQKIRTKFINQPKHQDCSESRKLLAAEGEKNLKINDNLCSAECRIS